MLGQFHEFDHPRLLEHRRRPLGARPCVGLANRVTVKLIGSASEMKPAMVTSE